MERNNDIENNGQGKDNPNGRSLTSQEIGDQDIKEEVNLWNEILEKTINYERF